MWNTNIRLLKPSKKPIPKMETLIKSMLSKGSLNWDTKFINKIQKNNRSEDFF